MRRKLLLLNAVLLAATIFAGFEFRRQYLAKKEREAAMLRKSVKPAPPPPVTPLPQAPPVMPTGYVDIADKMLFDKSRNSTVVVEVAPPPPPKPTPPFPILRGMMNLGDGITAVFSENAKSRPVEVKPGDRIGQFTLIAVNEKEAVFRWEDKTFHKPVEEILDRSRDEKAETARSVPVSPAATVTPVKSQTGPGAESGAGTRTCSPDDSTPVGAVVDGYRKVVTRTPFGEACRWEAVNR